MARSGAGNADRGPQGICVPGLQSQVSRKAITYSELIPGLRFATRISCFNHCRKTCKDKDRFIPLYEEFTRLSQNTPAHELARQEKRREDKWVGATVEADSDTIRIARLVLSDLGQYPDFLERWAEGISVHQVSKVFQNTMMLPDPSSGRIWRFDQCRGSVHSAGPVGACTQ